MCGLNHMHEMGMWILNQYAKTYFVCIRTVSTFLQLKWKAPLAPFTNINNRINSNTNSLKLPTDRNSLSFYFQHSVQLS
jgi:hypothetical protein